ncbi:hypothetical protein AB1E18_013337 [Capra hircus]
MPTIERPCGVGRAECETTSFAGTLQDAGEAEGDQRPREEQLLDNQAFYLRTLHFSTRRSQRRTNNLPF